MNMNKRLCLFIMGLFLAGILFAGLFAACTMFGDLDDLKDKAGGRDSETSLPEVITLDGDGTEESPYQINTAAQLAKLAELVNSGDAAYNAAYYKMTTDISLNVSPYNTGTGWMPIGTVTNPFKGNFNGNNRKVTSLYINSSTLENAGLFGYVSGGTLKNIGVESANITVYIRAGALAGYSTASTIINCYSTGIVKGNGWLGGLVGYSNSISYSYSTCAVSGVNTIGGLVGGILFGSGIVNCYATGAVSGVEHVGGLSGDTASSFITKSAALNPSVKASNPVYGEYRIVGVNWDNNSILTDNIAWSGLTNYAGATTWNDIGLNAHDGANITTAAIFSDGTLGGHFSGNGWTTENGKLPGLFGSTVAIPSHIF